MELIEFVKSHDVDYSYNRVDESFLLEMERITGAKIGDQLKAYILEYGYLGYEYVELFGVNSTQGVESDMIKRTVFLHDNFVVTRGYIAVEDQGDGDYYLVDGDDNVYRYIAGSEDLTATGLCLNGYIVDRLLGV